MGAYLMSLGVDVWTSVLVDYNVRDIPPTDGDGKTLYGNNVKAKNSILFGLSQSELVKVMHYKSAKEVWVKIKQSHEGDEKVKDDEVTNMIIGLSEEVKEEMIVQKILRSLPMRFNAKVSAIEEMDNLKDLKMDQLHGTLIASEMRVGIEKFEPKEETFKFPERPRSIKIIKTAPVVNFISSWLN
eukprot:PITA_01846